MKNICLGFVLLIFVSGVFAQNHSSHILPEVHPLKIKDDSYLNRLSFGIGFIKAFPPKSDILIDEKYYFLINSSLLFHIYKPLFLYAGLEMFKGGWNSVASNINVMPTFELGLYKNKFSLLIGAGGTLVGVKGGQALLGFELMLRPEYKINKTYTVGLEFKHYNYLRESTGEFIISGIVLLCYSF